MKLEYELKEQKKSVKKRNRPNKTYTNDPDGKRVA